MTQSVDKLGVDSENVPLTALAGRSGRTPSKRMTMGGPTMVPYRGSPVTSPLCVAAAGPPIARPFDHSRRLYSPGREIPTLTSDPVPRPRVLFSSVTEATSGRTGR